MLDLASLRFLFLFLPLFMLLFIICQPALRLASVWARLRAGWEARRPALYLALQPLEDLALLAMFIVGLAALVSGAFAPNLYASF